MKTETGSKAKKGNYTVDVEFTTSEKCLHREFLGIKIIFIGFFECVFYLAFVFWGH